MFPEEEKETNDSIKQTGILKMLEAYKTWQYKWVSNIRPFLYEELHPNTKIVLKYYYKKKVEETFILEIHAVQNWNDMILFQYLWNLK